MSGTSNASTTAGSGVNMPNPMGLNGFEFVEFTHDHPEALAQLFTSLGFTHIGTHRSKNVRHYRQGDINFILNMEPVRTRPRGRAWSRAGIRKSRPSRTEYPRD